MLLCLTTIQTFEQATIDGSATRNLFEESFSPVINFASLFHRQSPALLEKFGNGSGDNSDLQNPAVDLTRSAGVSVCRSPSF